MATNKYIFTTLISFLLLGCSVRPVHSRTIKNPPTKSFVKIFHKIEIFSCSNPEDKMCPIGVSSSSGSGVVIDLIKNETTVLTAGHVCDVGPTKKIKSYAQTVEVLDYKAQVHQAWPILISRNNEKGAPDACLLWVPTMSNVTKVKISKKAPVAGEDLYYIGAPAGVYHPPTALIFRATYAGPVSASSSLITAPVIGGASGSGVFNMNNEVVGIVWGVNDRFHHITMIVGHQPMKVFLQAAKSKFSSKITPSK